MVGISDHVQVHVHTFGTRKTTGSIKSFGAEKPTVITSFNDYYCIPSTVNKYLLTYILLN